jgi:hypothetical protein
MVSIDGTEISAATIDGDDVQEITADGDVVWTAGPDIPDSVTEHLDVWYPVDEGDGSVLSDSLDPANDATISGASWASGGYGNQSLDFDGGDNWVSDDTGDVTSGASICGWFDIDTIQRSIVWAISTDGASPDVANNLSFFVEIENGNIAAGSTNSSTATDRATIYSSPSTGTKYFLGCAVGDSGDKVGWIWDTDSQLDSGSSSPRDMTGGGDNYSLSGGAGVSAGTAANFDGRESAMGFAIDAKLTESDFEAIWNDTKGDVS